MKTSEKRKKRESEVSLRESQSAQEKGDVFVQAIRQVCVLGWRVILGMLQECLCVRGGKGTSSKGNEVADFHLVDDIALVARVTDTIIPESVARRHEDRAVPCRAKLSNEHVAVEEVGACLVVVQLLCADETHSADTLDRRPVDVAVARVRAPCGKNTVQLPGVDAVAKVLQSAGQAPHRIAASAECLRARRHRVVAPSRLADSAVCCDCCGVEMCGNVMVCGVVERHKPA